VQDKVWVSDPDGAPWEIYTVLSDAAVQSVISGDGGCCGTASSEVVVEPEAVAAAVARCC
jgi:hypothetical protein